jgi:hypothetical protein
MIAVMKKDIMYFENGLCDILNKYFNIPINSTTEPRIKSSIKSFICNIAHKNGAPNPLDRITITTIIERDVFHVGFYCDGKIIKDSKELYDIITNRKYYGKN